MKIRYEVKKAADHTRVDAAGEFDVADARQVLAAAIEAALSHQHRKILVDCRQVTGAPNTLQRFELAESVTRFYHQERGAVVIRVAIVGVEPLVDPDRFGQTVAQNRGLPVKITTRMEEALSWLEIAG